MKFLITINEKGIRTLKDLEELCIEAGGDYYLAKNT